MSQLSKIENALLDCQIKCSQSSWLQQFECAKYSLYNKIINITSIVVTSFTATSSVVVNTIDNKTVPIIKVIQTGNVILLYTASMLTALQHFLDYEKKAESHRTSSVRFNNLANNIKRTLVLDTDDKKILEDYYKFALNEYDTISGSSPDISFKSLNSFKKSFGVELKTLDNVVLSSDPIYIRSDSIISKTDSKEESIRYEIDRFLVNSYNNETL